MIAASKDETRVMFTGMLSIMIGFWSSLAAKRKEKNI